MPIWASTRRLDLLIDGELWLRLLDDEGDYAGRRRLGPVEDADVPEGLAGELAELVDRWRAADDRRDLVEEARASYVRNLGRST